MNHATSRQGYPDREPAPAEDTASNARAQAPRKVGRSGASAVVRPEQGDSVSSRPEAAFRGEAFRVLLRRDPEVARALAELLARGAVAGLRSQEVSARVDPGLMAAAKQRFGLASEADVINASLAVAAAPDRFKAWLRDTPDTLTDDFELAV